MANWDSGTVYSGFNAEQYVDTQIAGRENSRSEAATSVKSSYDVVGINVNKIPSVQTAITSYINKIKAQIDVLEPKAIASNAYLSDDVQTAVEQYITKVKTYCSNLISQLEAFSDKLDDVKLAWEQGAGKIADTIGNSNAAFSEGTEYVRQR